MKCNESHISNAQNTITEHILNGYMCNILTICQYLNRSLPDLLTTYSPVMSFIYRALRSLKWHCSVVLWRIDWFSSPIVGLVWSHEQGSRGTQKHWTLCNQAGVCCDACVSCSQWSSSNQHKLVHVILSKTQQESPSSFCERRWISWFLSAVSLFYNIHTQGKQWWKKTAAPKDFSCASGL